VSIPAVAIFMPIKITASLMDSICMVKDPFQMEGPSLVTKKSGRIN
jgi:hypothetical protein